LSATQTKIEQANAANSLSDTSRQYEFQILDAPKVPDRPAATLTRVAGYLAIGLVASFALIFIALAFATWQDTTIRNADDLERLTQVPILDSIPRLSSHPGQGGQHHHSAGAARAPQVSSSASPGQADGPATVYSSQVGE
jgi:hypothetical protein